MNEAGKYRYRVTIQSYNSTTKVWGTYTGAYAKILQTGESQDIQGDTPSTIRTYVVRIRPNASKTFTTRMRIAWTTQSATRYLYIEGIGADEETMYRETVFQCIEKTR